MRPVLSVSGSQGHDKVVRLGSAKRALRNGMHAPRCSRLFQCLCATPAHLHLEWFCHLRSGAAFAAVLCARSYILPFGFRAATRDAEISHFPFALFGASETAAWPKKGRRDIRDGSSRRCSFLSLLVQQTDDRLVLLPRPDAAELALLLRSSSMAMR